MLGPETQPRLPRQRGVVADDVHLGVVEERVLVEVRGADREPAVVDDADLRVHVDGVGERAVPGVERAGEEPAGAVVGLDQLGERPTRVVAARGGLAGNTSRTRKSGRRWAFELRRASTRAISGDQRNWFSR